MNTAHDSAGAQAVYDLWLGLIPQFFGQFGVTLPPGQRTSRPQDGVPGSGPMSDWMAQWSAAVPGFAAAAPSSTEGAAPSAGSSAAQSMFAPWAAMFAPYAGSRAGANSDSKATGSPGTTSPSGIGGVPGMFNPWANAMPFMPGAAGAGTPATAMQPLQAAQQAWLDFASRLSSGSVQSYMTGFERTFGGLFDALGFGPMRKLQAGLQELAAASVAQNQSRAAYGMLVQSAFASGAERLMKQLASMADAGERVESVLALLRMWAVSTETAVHEVLQSERGLEATAAMTRSSLAHRKKLQQVAGIVADSLDMATRRELDEVYREIHELKREVRALRSAATAPSQPAKAPRAPSTRRKPKS